MDKIGFLDGYTHKRAGMPKQASDSLDHGAFLSGYMDKEAGAIGKGAKAVGGWFKNLGRALVGKGGQATSSASHAAAPAAQAVAQDPVLLQKVQDLEKLMAGREAEIESLKGAHSAYQGAMDAAEARHAKDMGKVLKVNEAVKGSARKTLDKNKWLRRALYMGIPATALGTAAVVGGKEPQTRYVPVPVPSAPPPAPRPAPSYPPISLNLNPNQPQ